MSYNTSMNSMLKQFLFAILVLFLLLPLDGWGKGKKNPFPADVHVILIGFDGWGSYSVEKADMPVIKQMMSQGSWTLKKRSVLPSSSAANWASVFMGASPEIHGYTQWDSKTPEIPSAVIGEHKIFPTISQILRSQRKEAEIGLFSNWVVIKHIADSLAIDYVVHFPVNNLKDKYSGMTDMIGKYIVEKKPTLCTVVYDFPDHYGHSAGFESKEYYQSLKELDKCLAAIVQATKDAGIYDKTIFIVTSDHGGKDKGHGGKTLLEMETPFIVSGCNIKKGYEINEFMMQYDIAATIAYVFNLETPQAWIGNPVLSIFEKLRK